MGNFETKISKKKHDFSGTKCNKCFLSRLKDSTKVLQFILLSSTLNK